jgi:hypothetical protein
MHKQYVGAILGQNMARQVLRICQDEHRHRALSALRLVPASKVSS